MGQYAEILNSNGGKYSKMLQSSGGKYSKILQERGKSKDVLDQENYTPTFKSLVPKDVQKYYQENPLKFKTIIAPPEEDKNILEKSIELIGQGATNALETGAQSLRRIGEGLKQTSSGVKAFTGQQTFGKKEDLIRGIGETTVGAIEGVIGALPAVMALNTATPAIDKLVREGAKQVGVNEDLASNIANKIIPFVFGKWVGVGSLTAETVDYAIQESGALEGMNPRDSKTIRDLVHNGVFLGVVATGQYKFGKRTVKPTEIKEAQKKVLELEEMINPEVSKLILEQQDIKTQRLGLTDEVKSLKGQQGKEVFARRKEIIKEISELDKRNNEIEGNLKGTEIYAKPIEKPTELKIEKPEVLTKKQLAQDIKPIKVAKLEDVKIEPIAPPKTLETPTEKQPFEMTKDEYEKLSNEEYLYHATKPENLESIKSIGLIKQRSNKTSVDPRLNEEVVYGFPTIDRAREFAYDNNLENNHVIIRINKNKYKIVTDTEYDVGDSYAIKSNINNKDVLDVSDYHKQLVQQALKEGKTVPPEVLKDYPDLVEKQPIEQLKTTLTPKNFRDEFVNQSNVESEKSRIETAKQNKEFEKTEQKYFDSLPIDQAINEKFQLGRMLNSKESEYLQENQYAPSGYKYDKEGNLQKVEQPKLGKGQLELFPEIKNRFISEDSYAQARKNLQEKGMRLSTGLDPTVLKDLTVIGAYHLENLARAGIEKGKEFAEFSKLMIAELGQEIKPHLQKIYDSTVKEHQQTLDKIIIQKGEGIPTTPGYNIEKMNLQLQENYSQIFDILKEEINKGRRGRITHEQSKKAAIDYANNLNDNDVINIARGTVKNPEQTLGIRLYTENRAIESNKKLKEATPENFVEAYKDFEKTIYMNIRAQNLKSEYGRGLELSKVSINDDFVSALKEQRELIRSKNPNLADMLDNVDGLLKYEPTLKDKLSFIYYNSILSNPYTDIANTTGNSTNLGFEVLTKIPFQKPTASLAMIKGLKVGHLLGVREMQDIYHGRSRFDAKFIETVNRYDIKAKTNLGKIFRGVLPTTRLAMEDAYFRGLIKGMEGEIQATKLSKKTGESISTIKDYMNKAEKGEFDFKHSDKVVESLDFIDKQMDYLTFREPLGKNMQKFQNIVADKFWLKFIIPFVRTPYNIMRVGMDYSPIGFRRLFNKDLSLLERQAFTRRAVAGTVFWGGLLKLMGDSLVEITGQLTEDKDKKDILMRQGYRPNHIYISIGGEKYGVSYQNVNPLNVGLGMVGNWSDNMRFNKSPFKEDYSWTQNVSKAILGTVKTTLDQSFLQGAEQLLTAVQYQNKDYLDNWAANALVPNIASFPKQTMEYIKGEKPRYEAEGVIERVRRKFGTTEGLVPSYDVFGEQRESGYERFPFAVQTLKNKEVEQFLIEKNLNVSYPRSDTKLDEQKMTKKQFTEYVRTSGRNIYKRIKELLPLLKTMNTEEAQKLINQISNEERETAKETLEFNQ